MKNRIHNGYRMAVSAFVTYPVETLVDWELWLSTQHQEKGSYCILQSWEKNKNSTIVSTESILLLTILVEKSLS